MFLNVYRGIATDLKINEMAVGFVFHSISIALERYSIARWLEVLGSSRFGVDSNGQMARWLEKADVKKMGASYCLKQLTFKIFRKNLNLNIKTYLITDIKFFKKTTFKTFMTELTDTEMVPPWKVVLIAKGSSSA
jgi:hypothetical protein